MGVLSHLEPKEVFKYFEEICSIPHGSGNVKQISDYLVGFAKEHNIKYRQDEMFNVVMWKDATPGYENSETVVLQGHIDMVAVKDADCDKDLEKEGLDLEIEGDFITAKGTSLGGDDGIAVAYSLALLADDSIAHPALEVIFTADEETGLYGASFLDVSDIKGRLFMNMDSEEEGIFLVSCAGGVGVEARIPYTTEPITASIVEIKLDQFEGGHSGVEIHKGRVNTNNAMGRILLNVFQNVGMRLITINGGDKDNVIANLTEAAIAVLPETVDKVKEIIQNTFNEIKEEHKSTDPNANLTLNVMEGQLIETFSDGATLATIISLVNMPAGVQRMNPSIEGLVQTSLNMGILRTEDRNVLMSFAVRSSSVSEKAYVVEKIKSLVEIFGGNVKEQGAYPGWEFKEDSKLREVLVAAYKECTGKDALVEGIHAGLECGVFAEKMSNLDAVSFGPDMEHVHTTKERLSISSTERTWKLLIKALEMLK